MTGLLPRNALSGRRIGISVSESPDLARLGLLESHFQLALGEIGRAVLLADGSLAYGGHLEPTGYTVFLAQELERYGFQDSRLLVCLPYTVHRRLGLRDLLDREAALGLAVRVVYLGPDGEETSPDEGRGPEPAPLADLSLERRALTGMRTYMVRHIDARVLLGGQRGRPDGRVPGLIEEVVLTLRAAQPLYLAGGFGGVTADIADALGVGGNWMARPADRAAPTTGYLAGMRELQDLRPATKPWKVLRNGLTRAENARLAASHRPSDIAALVTLGLSRVAAARRPDAGA
jgi:hypothetical protein